MSEVVMIKEFTVTIASDEEHDKVFAEIFCGEKFVALVSQEKGVDRLEIEFPPAGIDEKLIMRAVDMEGFQQALVAAMKRLRGQMQSN